MNNPIEMNKPSVIYVLKSSFNKDHYFTNPKTALKVAEEWEVSKGLVMRHEYPIGGHIIDRDYGSDDVYIRIVINYIETE